MAGSPAADGWSDERRERMREAFDDLLAVSSLSGEEAAIQDRVAELLSDLGFDIHEWDVDPAALASNSSFPDPATLDVADRPSVGGVLELGDPNPDAGRTLVLNGHADVVPAERSAWTGDPFEPRWADGRVTARGAADMKGGLVACVFAARAVADRAAADGDLDGRIVVESVAGEEDGGFGAATAAAASPYPFERDAALIAEPTELDLVVASEGSLMARLTVYGRSAHAATKWEGESVLPHFERIRRAFLDLERERSERVTHPLYDGFETPWPVNVGRVEAGSWASTVPAELTAEFRIGVAPGETVDGVEAEFRDRLAEVVAGDDWLSAHPPDFERFSVQFEGSQIDPDEPIAAAVRRAARGHGREPENVGFTGGTDARHYVAAGIPTAVFGPGSIDQAHQPDETADWAEIVDAARIIADAAASYLRAE